MNEKDKLENKDTKVSEKVTEPVTDVSALEKKPLSKMQLEKNLVLKKILKIILKKNLL